MSKINSAIDTGLAVAQAPQNPTGALMQVPKVAIYAAEKALGDKADPEKVNDAYALASDVGNVSMNTQCGSAFICFVIRQ